MRDRPRTKVIEKDTRQAKQPPPGTEICRPSPPGTKGRIHISRKRLEEIVKENWKEARPYTGEYHMGKADLANELLGNPEIDWDKHPMSLENMIRSSKERTKT